MLIKNVLLNTLFLFFFVTLGKWGTLQVGHCSTKRFHFPERRGMRIFLITKGCAKKKMRHPIFMNKPFGLRDESTDFLHNFACSCLYVIRKQLTICVFAGLTRKLILAPSNATRCVPTPFIE